jgi:5-methylcytosine-specific restriction endonuclease McrA
LTETHKGGYHARGRTVGHIVAMANGGAHTWDNVWLECHACNSRKGTKTLPAFSFKPAKRSLPPSLSPRARESLRRSGSSACC